MKTDKYNQMIVAFSSDFVLARDGNRKLSELDTMIKNNNERIMNDIELLEELEYNLRHGKAEIHLIETVENKKHEHTEFFIRMTGTQRGLYCCECGKWLKWLGKDEFNSLRYKPNYHVIYDRK